MDSEVTQFKTGSHSLLVQQLNQTAVRIAAANKKLKTENHSLGFAQSTRIFCLA